MFWIRWVVSKIRWILGLGFTFLAAATFLLPTLSKTGQAVGEAANLERLQAQIAPELAEIKAQTQTPVEVSPGVVLTEIQVFQSQMKFVYRLDLKDPMAWLAQFSAVNGERSQCAEEAGFGYHLLTHGMTQMQDFHSRTPDGRKVFRQIVHKPFECRGRPGFEFLTARR